MNAPSTTTDAFGLDDLPGSLVVQKHVVQIVEFKRRIEAAIKAPLTLLFLRRRRGSPYVREDGAAFAICREPADVVLHTHDCANLPTALTCRFAIRA